MRLKYFLTPLLAGLTFLAGWDALDALYASKYPHAIFMAMVAMVMFLVTVCYAVLKFFMESNDW